MLVRLGRLGGEKKKKIRDLCWARGRRPLEGKGKVSSHNARGKKKRKVKHFSSRPPSRRKGETT